MKIRSKIMLTGTIILLSIFMFQSVLQKTIFQTYYIKHKENRLEEISSDMKEEIADGGDVDKFINELKSRGVLALYLGADGKIINGSLRYTGNLTIKEQSGKITKASGIEIESDSVPLRIGEQVSGIFVKYLGDEFWSIKSISTIDENGEHWSIISLDGVPLGEVEAERTFKGELIGMEPSHAERDNQITAMYNYVNSDEEFFFSEGTQKLRKYEKDYLFMTQRFKGGYIVLSMVLEDSKETIDLVNSFNMILLLIVLIFVAIIGMLLSKLISDPLVKMKDAAEDIAQQKFKYKLQLKSKDEIGELSEALRCIAESFELNITTLEKANQQLKEEYGIRLENITKQKMLMRNISHDLKTPLTVIKGYLKGVSKGLYDKDEYINKSVSVVDDISSTLSNMVELTKYQNKGRVAERYPVDLSGIIFQEYDNIRELFKGKNQEVHIDVSYDLFVMVNEEDFHKVFQNVLANAGAYSPEGAHIWVEEREEEDKVVIEIVNSGVTLQQEDIERIFDEFYRCDESRNSHKKGNGLGLAIVKLILDEHQAEYDIENSPRGVVFRIKLNRITEECF